MKRVIGILAFMILSVMGLLAMSPDRSERMVRDNVVMLRGDLGQCSGIQIQAPSGKSYILSAAHCKAISSTDSVEVTLDDHSILSRRIIAEDGKADLLLIEGAPSLPGIRVASDLYLGEHIRTLTHGKGHSTYKTEGNTVEYSVVNMLVGPGASCPKGEKYQIVETIFGELCLMHANFMVTTARVIPGSSGGAIVNDSGELAGIVSWTDDSMLFSGMVTLVDIHRFLKNY